MKAIKNQPFLTYKQMNEVNKQYKAQEKTPMNALLCDRCHVLKVENRLLDQKLEDEEQSGSSLRAGQAVNLSRLATEVV